MSILDLWLPILVSGVICFVASSVIWVVIKWHNSDYKKADREDDVRAALKGSAPGFYVLPYCIDFKEMEKPEVRQKFDDGPNQHSTALPCVRYLYSNRIRVLATTPHLYRAACCLRRMTLFHRPIKSSNTQFFLASSCLF